MASSTNLVGSTRFDLINDANEGLLEFSRINNYRHIDHIVDLMLVPDPWQSSDPSFCKFFYAIVDNQNWKLSPQSRKRYNIPNEYNNILVQMPIPIANEHTYLLRFARSRLQR
jgi:hypothetical protein